MFYLTNPNLPARGIPGVKLSGYLAASGCRPKFGLHAG
jgi:hypothetical protein